MSQDRKKKLRKREQRRISVERKMQELFDEAIKRAGLELALHRIPQKLKEILRNARLPIPQMRLDTSVQHDPDALEIQRRFSQLIYEPSAEDESGLCFVEYVCVLIATVLELERLERELHATRTNLETASWPDILALTGQLREFLEQHEQKINDGFLYRMWFECVLHSKVNERVFWFELDNYATMGRKHLLLLVLHRTVPERIRINVDGGTRAAFRCCVFDGPKGMKEITWASTDIGMPGEPRAYPVYIQNHVLEQLERRIRFDENLSVAESLREPRFAKQNEDHFLVEYRYGEYKLGYFVGVRLMDRVLLKTFLFLTMQGTPESDLLFRRLRLTRRDVEYMQLDELFLFVETDVRRDPELTRIFQECGCGHLLTMQTPGFQEECRLGYAENLRKYLRTGPGWEQFERRSESAAKGGQLMKDLGE